MPQQEVHHCQCSNCFSPDHHPDQEIHRQMNLLLSRLDEQQRRWYAAVESARLGHGGDRSVSRLTGLHVDTIRRGREELAASLQDRRNLHRELNNRGWTIKTLRLSESFFAYDALIDGMIHTGI